jgi:hypothetical protein
VAGDGAGGAVVQSLIRDCCTCHRNWGVSVFSVCAAVFGCGAELSEFIKLAPYPRCEQDDNYVHCRRNSEFLSRHCNPVFPAFDIASSAALSKISGLSSAICRIISSALTSAIFSSI